jgi:hypothetical protein
MNTKTVCFVALLFGLAPAGIIWDAARKQRSRPKRETRQSRSASLGHIASIQTLAKQRQSSGRAPHRTRHGDESRDVAGSPAG